MVDHSKQRQALYFKLLFGVLVFLAVLGFQFYQKVNPIPVTTYLDLVILLSAIFFRPVIKSRNVACLFVLLLLYVSISFGYSVWWKRDHLFDFLLAYKAFFYLTLLSFIWGKSLFSGREVLILFRVLIVLFALKYSISIFGGLNGRPWLFRENNFELMFLGLFFLLRSELPANIRIFEWTLVTLIFVISGSKSALPIFIVVSSAVLLKRLTLNQLVLAVVVIFSLSSAFVSVMMQKISVTGIEGIDRLAFLRVFIDEMRNSSIFEIIFGHPRLTVLMDSSCQSLNFFQGLFSYNDNGTCYSPVLHTFILRTVFDHGVIGLLSVVCVCHYLLVKAGFGLRVALTFNFAMLLNGMSVSGYNSGFFALAMLLFLGVAKDLNGNRVSPVRSEV